MAIKGLNSRALGTYRLLVLFFREFLDVVKPEILGTINKLYIRNRWLECINKSYLFPLPKYPGIVHVSYFRPISLSNSLCLNIVKVLASRL